MAVGRRMASQSISSQLPPRAERLAGGRGHRHRPSSFTASAASAVLPTSRLSELKWVFVLKRSNDPHGSVA
jgi:hypothetical protein